MEDLKSRLKLYGSFNRSRMEQPKFRPKKSAFAETCDELLFMLKLIVPFLWPRDKPRLKFLIAFSGLTVIANGIVNLYVPIYAQRIVDSMTTPSSIEHAGNSKLRLSEFRWDLILTFVALKFMQGIGALSFITFLQQLMWLPIEQHTRHQIQVTFFEHLHSLSLNWMMGIKTGDILGALERGTESIASTLEHLLYSIGPTVADIVVAMCFLAFKFGWVYGLIVGIQIVLYLVFTIYGVEKRSQFQRAINAGENDLNQKVLESLVNYETVKCFGNEDFEKEKYSKSLNNLHRHHFLVACITFVIHTVQLILINGGFLICSLILVWTITRDGTLTPGDYVLCTTFLIQLYAPLNYLALYYKELRVNLIKVTHMLEYFQEEPEIFDAPNAEILEVTDGTIEFREVTYAEGTGHKIIDNVSFKVPAGETVALVGPSGAGKSSIARMLFRLLDSSSGEVTVDGKNVKDVTMESLRGSLGIVPQDTILFNDTIRNNIKYGKLDATDYEIALAATAAQLHDRIMSFPDGYDTIVGERGTRLSGGERQRVAIARAILKNPKILILDEATSALDPETEKEIQESLKLLCKNRTCIMITHKLAPAAEANSILVLKEGRLVEHGEHSTLLSRPNGLYASMWKQQHKSEENDKSIGKKYDVNNRML